MKQRGNSDHCLDTESLSNQYQLFLKHVHLKVHPEVFFTDKMIFYILGIILESKYR